MPVCRWAAQTAACPDDAPPRDVVGGAEQVPHGAGRARKACFLGYLPVCDDLTTLQGAQDGDDGVLERRQIVPNRRSPMSPRPGVM